MRAEGLPSIGNKKRIFDDDVHHDMSCRRPCHHLFHILEAMFVMGVVQVRAYFIRTKRIKRH
eukprot:3345457-Amphidinium_carterae.1